MKALQKTLPVALIVLGPAVMLYTLWGDPTSAGEDDVIYYYPLRRMVGRALREGRWPLHNPYEATGMPLMGDPQSAVMYPPTWLFAAIQPKLAYTLTLFLAFSLAGGGAYVYLRRIGLIRPAACFGAAAFMFSGFLVGHRVHWSVLHAGAYLPWGLWCIEHLRRRPGKAFLWMVPTAFLAIAAGHGPTAIHVGLIWSAYLLLRGRPIARSLAVAAAAMILAVALAGPQIDATLHVWAQATRNRLGYATTGENSFFPASGVLALFPMLLGCRTPNFFPTDWWGPWHLCETLGYVGLVTLVLAAATVWKLYRKKMGPEAPKEAPPAASSDGPPAAPAGRAGPGLATLQPIVRTWAWIALGAGIWMLGYYLPTYRLIHMLPILGVVRCPARMVLAVDMALATLAAIGVHLSAVGGGGGRVESLRRCVRWGASRGLPGAMLVVLILVAAVGAVSVAFFGGEVIFFDRGGAGWHALRAVLPTNPAVWVQFALAAATFLVVRAWLAAPRRRAGGLVMLVLVDLFFVARFVDTPAADAVAPDPSISPAAEWLGAHGGLDGSYRVWGIGETYHDRPAELLRPKTAHALGIPTINTYGPFQAPAHAQLLGFRIFGTNRDWAALIRRNRLLSLYGVRYLLTARQDVRETIESVRIPDAPPPPDGPNLLSDAWWLDLAERTGRTLRLRTPVLWRWSIAKQPVALQPSRTYRISLDARGPEDGAANYLRAEINQRGWSLTWAESDLLGLTAHTEQIGREWRHFEWTFHTPADLARKVLFRVFTMSERPIEVRNIELRASHWEQPVDPAGRLPAGEKVYRLATELPALAPGAKPVAIYENRLVVPPEQRPPARPATSREIERVKWRRGGPQGPADSSFLPEVGLRVGLDPRRALLATTLPAGLVYLLVATGLLARFLRRRKR